MTASLETVLVDLVGALEAANVDYVLVGGMAVLAWGDPRTTRDIDVIADLDGEEIPRLGESLTNRGFTFDREGARKAIRQGSHFTVFHEDSFYHADLVPSHEPSHRWTLEGRERVELEGETCWIASPEDTVANKLVFGSEQDIQDAAGILARVGDDLDIGRLESLCRKLGVLAELQRLRARVDEIDE